MVGMGGQVDARKLGMNRAAEQAMPEAKQIFLRQSVHYHRRCQRHSDGR